MNLWHMCVDGEYIMTLFGSEEQLGGFKDAYLIFNVPLYLNSIPTITFYAADPDDLEEYNQLIH